MQLAFAVLTRKTQLYNRKGFREKAGGNLATLHRYQRPQPTQLSLGVGRGVAQACNTGLGQSWLGVKKVVLPIFFSGKGHLWEK